jgi:uncharacterized protein
MFETIDRERLLLIARAALEARVRRQSDPSPAGGGALDTMCGAFVSIHRGEELRGCLGRLECEWPVSRVVAHLGRAVADSDPRFQPVSVDELALVSIEISVITPEREVQSISEIEIGRHGLIVERGYRRGLLLPQVATQYGWDVSTFLGHTCAKAGLPADAWQRGATLYVFEAEVFGETNGAGIMRVFPNPSHQ